jgi:hypothetical protein
VSSVFSSLKDGTMCAANRSSDWERILADAAHCKDCSEPVCMKVCPNGIDLRAVLSLLLPIKPGFSWVDDLRGAVEFVDDAIGQSFA